MASQLRGGSDEPLPEPEYYDVTYEMMAKGSDVQRGRRKVRQFAVLVNGSVRVVTSGDTVDRETYRALVASNAIRPEYIHLPEAAGQESDPADDSGQGRLDF